MRGSLVSCYDRSCKDIRIGEDEYRARGGGGRAFLDIYPPPFLCSRERERLDLKEPSGAICDLQMGFARVSLDPTMNNNNNNNNKVGL